MYTASVLVAPLLSFDFRFLTTGPIVLLVVLSSAKGTILAGPETLAKHI